jgi:hypothetical protein
MCKRSRITIKNKKLLVLGFSRMEFTVQLLVSGMRSVECLKLSNVSQTLQMPSSG